MQAQKYRNRKNVAFPLERPLHFHYAAFVCFLGLHVVFYITSASRVAAHLMIKYVFNGLEHFFFYISAMILFFYLVQTCVSASASFLYLQLLALVGHRNAGFELAKSDSSSPI